MKSFQFSTVLLIVLFLIAGCKKNTQENKEDLPVFETCKSVIVEGHLSVAGTDNSKFTYLTRGGGKIVRNGYVITFSHSDYPDFTIEFWGEGHENLNGKHVKDRTGSRRTIIFPDGTKITTNAASTNGVIDAVTIYEGNECHHVNFTCNTVEYSSANSSFAKKLDEAEADGETGTFEFTTTGLLFLNIYSEDTPGNNVQKRVPIGEIYKAEPNKVTDYWN